MNKSVKKLINKGLSKNIQAGDKIGIQGFVEIEIEDTRNHTKRTYTTHNAITKGGKQFLLAHSAAAMLNMSANMHGNINIAGSLINGFYESPAAKNVYKAAACLTNTLLNLGALQTGLTEDSTFINLFASTGEIDSSKIVGYANNNIVPTADGKEGSINYNNAAYMSNMYTVSERWKYDLSVASGTFDTLVMLPATWVKDGIGGKAGGHRLSKGLDKVNRQYTNFAAGTTQFCIPGITGFTSNDEILLNYSQDSIAQHKYNLSTGVTTDSPTTWFVFPAGTTDVIKIGDYVYSIIGTTGIVYVWLASTMNQVTTIDVSSFSTPYESNYRLFKDSTNQLWVSIIENIISTGSCLCKLTSNGTYFATKGTLYSDFSQIVTLPTSINYKNVNFGNLGSNYIMYVRQSNYDPTYNRAMSAIIFTDVTNIMGTVIDIIPNVYDTSTLYYAGTTYGVLDIGRGAYNNTDLNYDTSLRNKKIVNNSTTADLYNSTGGLYLTLQGNYSTLMSFVKLPTPIVKSDTDIIYVTYGYRIV